MPAGPDMIPALVQRGFMSYKALDAKKQADAITTYRVYHAIHVKQFSAKQIVRRRALILPLLPLLSLPLTWLKAHAITY
jgi:hypothetical protein